MADNPETARARRLLKSSEELLERSRNRPRVEVREWQPAPKAQALAPVVPQRAAKPQPSGKMDLESSKAWNAWANKIANRVANEHCSALVEVMGDKLIPRIIELEAEVAKLKGEPKPRLKSVGGRDA